MKTTSSFLAMGRLLLAAVCAVLLFSACQTGSKIDWPARVGNYTYDQAVTEMGPPDKAAKLTDGTTVNEWLLQRGSSGGLVQFHRGWWYERVEENSGPDYFLRLTFGADGKLKEWKRVWR